MYNMLYIYTHVYTHPHTPTHTHTHCVYIYTHILHTCLYIYTQCDSLVLHPALKAYRVITEAEHHLIRHPEARLPGPCNVEDLVENPRRDPEPYGSFLFKETLQNPDRVFLTPSRW